MCTTSSTSTTELIYSLSAPSSLNDHELKLRLKSAIACLHDLRAQYDSIRISLHSPSPKQRTAKSATEISPASSSDASKLSRSPPPSEESTSPSSISQMTSTVQQRGKRHDNLQINMTTQAWQPLGCKRERKPRVPFGERESMSSNKSKGKSVDSRTDRKRKRSQEQEQEPSSKKRV